MTSFSCRARSLRLRVKKNEMTWRNSRRQGGRGESAIESVEGRKAWHRKREKEI